MPFDAEHFESVRLLDRDPKTITDPKERLMYLRDFLRELPPERFKISSFFSNSVGTPAERTRGCGTTACVGGWCLALFRPDYEIVPISVPELAGEILGLDREQRGDIFFPAGFIGNSIPRSAAQAANVLDHLIRTGEVDWSRA